MPSASCSAETVRWSLRALRILVAAAEILEHDNREPRITESARDGPAQLPELTHLARQEHRACRGPTRERVSIQTADGRRCVDEKRHVVNDGGTLGGARPCLGLGTSVDLLAVGGLGYRGLVMS